MTPTPDYDVFISYNRRDATETLALASCLSEEKGLRIWFDRERLNPGAAWRDGIESAMRNSNACLVVWGRYGIGRVQAQERGLAYAVRDVRPRFRVVYVLLPGVPAPEATWANVDTWIQFGAGIGEPDVIVQLVAALQGMAPPRILSANLPDEPAPYRGLAPFGVTDAPFFAGRAAELERVLELLNHYPFLAILGSSGSGKTSLVQAGLLAHLRAGGLRGSQSWITLVVRPGPDPLRSLAFELARLSTGQDPLAVVDARYTRLSEDPESILEMVRAVTLDDARIVLVVDRLEEIFTLADPQDGEVALFIAALLALCRDARAAVWVIATMRADFYGRIDQYPDLAQIISRHQVFVGALSPENVREIIEEPAARVGALFETGLADQVFEDARQSGSLILPLLQLTLELLWRKRRGRWLTWAAYNEIGRLSGALRYHAGGVIDALDDEAVRVARHLLCRLVWVGEEATQRASRRVEKALLVDRSFDPRTNERVLEHLADRRLVTVSDTTPATVELIHDSLAFEWDWLRAAVADDLIFLRWRQDLAFQIAQWVRSGTNPAALQRGSLLEDARKWAKERAADLGGDEVAFINEGTANEALAKDEDQYRLWQAETRALAGRWKEARSARNLLGPERLAEAHRWDQWHAQNAGGSPDHELDSDIAAFIEESERVQAASRARVLRRARLRKQARTVLVRGAMILIPAVVIGIVSCNIWIRSDRFQVNEIKKDAVTALSQFGPKLDWLDILVRTGGAEEAVRLARAWHDERQRPFALQRVAVSLGPGKRADELNRASLDEAIAGAKSETSEGAERHFFVSNALESISELARALNDAKAGAVADEAWQAARREWINRKIAVTSDKGIEPHQKFSAFIQLYRAGRKAKAVSEATEMWSLAKTLLDSLDAREQSPALAELLREIPPQIDVPEIVRVIRRGVALQPYVNKDYWMHIALGALQDSGRAQDAVTLASSGDQSWLTSDTRTTEDVFRKLAKSHCCSQQVERLAEAMPGNHNKPKNKLMVSDMWRTYARHAVLQGLADADDIEEARRYLLTFEADYPGGTNDFACFDVSMARALARAGQFESAAKIVAKVDAMGFFACPGIEGKYLLEDFAISAARKLQVETAKRIMPKDRQSEIQVPLAEGYLASGQQDKADQLFAEIQRTWQPGDSHLSSDILAVARAHIRAGQLRQARLLSGTRAMELDEKGRARDDAQERLKLAIYGAILEKVNHKASGGTFY